MLALFWKSNDATVINVVPSKPCVLLAILGKGYSWYIAEGIIRAVVKKTIGAYKDTKSAQKAQNAK